jgi:Chaperone for flagella basal body P-ring formation
MKIALLFLSMVPAWGACVPVETDRILAKDLASANQAFAAVDPAIEIGFSPLPGVTRVMRPAELAALARKLGVAASPDSAPFESVCFVRTASSVAAAVASRKPALAEPDVLRGEHVAVVVTSGAALLRFQADAESSGRRGDNVLVRNPDNGKLFQARVEGKGKVTIQR